jgi:hypothetical protein
MRPGWKLLAIAGVAIVAGADVLAPAEAEAQRTATVWELTCRIVDAAAETNRLPASFLTRVLWQESGFRTDVTSPAGAAGVAQFMPETAAERGLADPYDPGPAIDQAARLLAEFSGRFGNLGLAAAAYNAGAARISRWLHAQSELPTETQLYVLAVTGHRAEEWRASPIGSRVAIEHGSCLGITADLARAATRVASARTAPAPMAMWQVRLDEFLAKAIRLRQQRPGTVPVSNANRAAETFCDRIRAMGAPCAVYQR